MNPFKELVRAYRDWLYLRNCICINCRVKVSSKQARRSIFYKTCEEYFNRK